LRQRSDLAAEQVAEVIEALLAARLSEEVAAEFLLALRAKGESAEEIAEAARTVRRHMLAWDAGRHDILDTCGTGGDGAGTFNISTATALVVAGAGVPVVKHGNRSVSSSSGSADVLTELAVPIEGDGACARRSLEHAGLAFCFAPNFHPALKHLGPIRRKLKTPTIFNWLGPLANPAGARRQLLGVGKLEMLDRMAQALARLGTEHSLLVCSRDGLDEVSLSAPTLVREVRGSDVHAHEWTAADFGLAACSLGELTAADPRASALLIEEVLAGKEGAALRIVLANAAAALLAADRVTSLRDGVELGRAAVREGKALLVLQKLREGSR
jgi:anthranilate phosphoribosyltransferase